MVDLQLIFILCAVVVVLILARYLQMFFEELTKESKVKKVLKRKAVKNQANDIADSDNGVEYEPILPSINPSVSEPPLTIAEKNLGTVLSLALLHILNNIVILESQHRKLLETGTFDKKLHSSNLISRIKIDYEIINSDLRNITNQEGGKDLAKNFQIMIEHVKHIDYTFQESGLVRDYVVGKSNMMEMRFLELKSLANLLFLKSLKLNPQIVNDEALKVFMKKYPAYFKIKL